MKDTQMKLLNKDYLKTRIEEMPPVRRGEVSYTIEESDRMFSKTLYVSFWTPNPMEQGKWFKGKTLRLSDHLLEECVHDQLLVNPEKELTKKKKETLMRALDLTYRKSLLKNVNKAIKELSKGE